MVKLGSNLKSLIKQDYLKQKEITTTQDYAGLFINDLYNTIKKLELQDDHIPTKTFKPSSMKCARNMQYQIMGAEPDKNIVNPPMVRIAECGTDSHLRIQHWIAKMKEAGFDCEYVNVADYVRSRNLTDLEILKEPTADEMETKLYNKKYNITFMCDGILKYMNRYFIFEFKTESSHKHNGRKAMNEEHIPQICAYYLSFKIPLVMMLYENRDTCTHKAYCVEVNDNMVWENVLSKIEEVNSSIQLGTLAKANIGNHCQYCNYVSRCKRGVS